LPDNASGKQHWNQDSVSLPSLAKQQISANQEHSLYSGAASWVFGKKMQKIGNLGFKTSKKATPRSENAYMAKSSPPF
jgi:hypothetical protein